MLSDDFFLFFGQAALSGPVKFLMSIVVIEIVILELPQNEAVINFREFKGYGLRVADCALILNNLKFRPATPNARLVT